MTKFNAIIDISSVVWNENDFELNKSKYYNLIYELGNLFDKMQNEKPNILIRKELREIIIEGFPFNKLPNKFYEFGNIFYSFLGNISANFIEYENNKISNIKSIPNQLKAHYKKPIQEEIGYLISKIHSDNESDSKYFTFQYFWNNKDRLQTEVNGEVNEYETIISDNGADLDVFFAKYKPIFEHNPKHNKTNYNTKEMWEKSNAKSSFVSRLSCYNGNSTEPQRILNLRYPILLNSCFFSFDENYETYVVFRRTENNVFHGYDENNIELIPNEVRKHFNK